MILSPAFRKTVCISVLGHLVLFNIFSFSFGRKIPRADFSGVSFLGQLFYNLPLTRQGGIQTSMHPALSDRPVSCFLQELRRVSGKTGELLIEGKTRLAYIDTGDYFRPPLFIGPKQDKAIFIDQPATRPFTLKEKPVIMFYPALPRYFTLYFKDRQMVHIELMFNVAPAGKRGAVTVKRKISSGNLEADLLSMRYISRYLYMQQGFFISDKWQTVKIDLSAKDNK